MVYCRNCGSEINENDRICPNCKASQPIDSMNYTPSPIQQDNGGCLFGLLGFFIPIAGLILWLVWKDNKPKTAKAVGLGALFSVGIGVLFYILIFVFSFALMFI